jgi:nitrogen fixation protein
MIPTLGQLKRINLREAWKNEALDFTPWLAQVENLNHLADALGLSELELVQTEYQVGDFKLDILCSDDDGEIIIENQLEKTNHTHLGQIITYAAGVGAKKVIWVAESFRSEHVAALDFLNQNTTSDLNFFAVEVELWRIADSPMAPSFNVVVKPNDWSKSNRESARVAATATPTKILQQQFWVDWVKYLEAKKSPLRPQKPRPQHWLTISLGRSGINLGATVNSRENRLGLEVYINHQDAKNYFSQLKQQSQSVELKLGFELDWRELPDKNACRILIYKNDAPLSDETAWPSYFDWLSDTAFKLDQVFRPLVKELK